MTVKEKLGNLSDFDLAGRHVDWLPMEWYETRKRILHKRTLSGKEVTLRFLSESPEITQRDILFEDMSQVIAVDIVACDCIIVKPVTIFETASLCYEIGNKHLPLFFENNCLLVPFEAPLFRLLTAQGYPVLRENRRLLQPLKTTVSPHGDQGTTSLFSKIMQLAGPSV
ncbi:urease accessory protein UreE [Dyadobacter sp. CY312]|uniref:urease accessory protein UreE n=1 Tax=Dyadobacter sp. CY312 TaxID=2907303 RepID=UPI001F27CFAC|nr:urease accessory protein UreE [Dyadobacter sp. CY312]MCE7042663.1 urease accessory protein UreE [Dyadobacter sp. CY312]